jgi:hypothetical protein
MRSKLPALLVIAAIVVAAVIAHLKLGVSLGVALFVLLVGWPIIGTLITLDDDLPGGWSNPDGSVRPPWREAPFWGQIVAGLALSAAGFAVDVGWQSRVAVPYWIAALSAALIAGTLIARKR